MLKSDLFLVTCIQPALGKQQEGKEGLSLSFMVLHPQMQEMSSCTAPLLYNIYSDLLSAANKQIWKEETDSERLGQDLNTNPNPLL